MIFNIWITGTVLTFMFLSTDSSMSGAGPMNAIGSVFWPLTWALLIFVSIADWFESRKRWKEFGDVGFDKSATDERETSAHENS